MEQVHEWLILGGEAGSRVLSLIQSQANRGTYLRYPKDGNFLTAVLVSHNTRKGTKWLDGTYLLFEVAPVLFVNEDEIEIVARAELFVHVAECRRQVKPAEE